MTVSKTIDKGGQHKQIGNLIFMPNTATNIIKKEIKKTRFDRIDVESILSQNMILNPNLIINEINSYLTNNIENVSLISTTNIISII